MDNPLALVESIASTRTIIGVNKGTGRQENRPFVYSSFKARKSRTLFLTLNFSLKKSISEQDYGHVWRIVGRSGVKWRGYPLTVG